MVMAKTMDYPLYPTPNECRVAREVLQWSCFALDRLAGLANGTTASFESGILPSQFFLYAIQQRFKWDGRIEFRCSGLREANLILEDAVDVDETTRLSYIRYSRMGDLRCPQDRGAGDPELFYWDLPSGNEIVRGRALIEWSRADLARKAGLTDRVISKEMIADLENGKAPRHALDLNAVAEAFVRAGVRFKGGQAFAGVPWAPNVSESLFGSLLTSRPTA